MNTRKGILLDTSFDLQIRPERKDGMIVKGLVVGNTTDQDAALVLSMNQGELKEDGLLGVGLVKYVGSKYNRSKIDVLIKTHFTRIGIDYEDYKSKIDINIK